MRTRTRINLKAMVLAIAIGLAMYYWGAALVTAIVVTAVIQISMSTVSMLYIVVADMVRKQKDMKLEILAHQGLIQKLLHDLRQVEGGGLKSSENAPQEASAAYEPVR